jgi:hypothetical protein
MISHSTTQRADAASTLETASSGLPVHFHVKMDETPDP